MKQWLVLMIALPLWAEGIPPLLVSQEIFSSTSGQQGRILLIENEHQQVITSAFEWAGSPSVSFDGKKILFSGRMKGENQSQIWQRDLLTGDLTQITHIQMSCDFPLYAGCLFHLDDKAPVDQIIFLGKTGNKTRLFVCGLDGESPEQISFNLYSERQPEILDNGRIVFVSTRQDGSSQLLALNNDGTDLQVFARTEKPFQLFPRLGPDRLFFLETNGIPEHENIASASCLSYVTLRRPTKSYRNLVTLDQGVFSEPCPLPDGSLIIGFQQDQQSEFDLFRLDPETGQKRELILHTPGWHCIGARPVLTRPKVKGRSTVVDLKKETGVFFCMDVNESTDIFKRNQENHPARQVRILEGNPETGLEMVLGTAPIEEDGSFHVEVPAKTPLRFELLDQQGDLLASQKSWSWVLPNEKRGCIGCHEDPELAVPNKLAQAILKPAVALKRRSDP